MLSEKMMRNLSRVRLSKGSPDYNPSASKVFNGRLGIWFHNFSSYAGISPARRDQQAGGSYSGRISANYSIFKGKGALILEPVPAKFKEISNGLFKVDRKGSMMLKFMPALGLRKYNHEKRQMFALSATEIGSIMSLSPGESCEFFHDPSITTSQAGQVRKSLSVTPTSDGSYFFTLSVTNSIEKTNERISVPVSKAEFAVMRTSLAYILPHILGWDRIASPQPMNEPMHKPKESELKVNPDLEWGK